MEPIKLPRFALFKTSCRIPDLLARTSKVCHKDK